MLVAECLMENLKKKFHLKRETPRIFLSEYQKSANTKILSAKHKFCDPIPSPTPINHVAT